ncbi:MAG: hypothetical protein IJ568_03885 [Bacilli bacterium]|nr:hypothetical protein [Bacilli bacterium]
MKYYYLNNEGYFKDRIKSGKDIEKINNLKNGLIIAKTKNEGILSKTNNTFSLDNYSYMIIKIKNSIIEKEKKELLFDELIEYLENNNPPYYFINIPKKDVESIIYWIKNKGDNQKVEKYDVEKYIYVEKDGKILKTEVSINKDLLKEAIEQEYYLELDEKQEMKLSDFIGNDKLLKKVKIPLLTEHNKLILPKYNSFNSVFYSLSDLYSEVDKSNRCKLDEKVLNNLLYQKESSEKKETEELITEIIKNLKIDVVKEYDKEEFEKSFHFMEMIRDDEYLFNKLNLLKLKVILTSSQNNKKTFEKIQEIKESKTLKK